MMNYSDVPTHEPSTNVEYLLDAIVKGVDVATFVPTTPVEAYLKFIAEHGSSAWTVDHDALTNRPKINGVTLEGDVGLDEIGAVSNDDLVGTF